MRPFSSLAAIFAVLLLAAGCGDTAEPAKDKEKETPFFSVSPKTFATFGSVGGDFSVDVVSNVGYNYSIASSCQSWIISTGTKASTVTTLCFRVAENESEESRSGELTVSGGDEKVTIKISQDGAKPVPPAPAEKSTTFDPSSIAASFALISDVHIDGVSTTTGLKFARALAQLRDRAAANDEDGIDAVIVAGDIINNAAYNTAYYVETDYFKSVYESVFDPVKVPMIYTIGNHDTYNWWTLATLTEAKSISNRFGETYFRNDIDKEALDEFECRHCVVNGYNILCITPISLSPVTYPDKAGEWLDSKLASITAAESEKYVFVITHPMIYNTVYGSDLGTYWYTESLTDILKKYPQAVTFSGHLHFPINDPRSIWQDDFTAFGCGSVRYMAIEAGGYEDMAGSTTMKDKDDISSGLFVQIDVSGNMRITKMFFSQDKQFGSPWEICYPQTDRSHLAKYNHSSLKAANTPPTLGNLEAELSATSTGAKTVTAKFAAASDDEFAHHYVLTLKKGGETLVTKKILSDFYRSAQPSDMKKEWSCNMGDFASGDYTLSLVAYDSWDAASSEVSISFTI